MVQVLAGLFWSNRRVTLSVLVLRATRIPSAGEDLLFDALTDISCLRIRSQTPAGTGRSAPRPKLCKCWGPREAGLTWPFHWWLFFFFFFFCSFQHA